MLLAWVIRVVPSLLATASLTAFLRDAARLDRLASWVSCRSVWVTANLYMPAKAKKNPTVLVVHGHWAGARRDPVVQSRCLGLVKLGFVVLAVDAFSSDSIPVHLLTVEAFELYFHHLKPSGVLAVHVSNKYLDLKPIVELAARTLGKETRMIDTDDEDEIGEFGATWVLVADHPFFLKPEIRDTGSKLLARQGLRLWTDDYSNLYGILK